LGRSWRRWSQLDCKQVRMDIYADHTGDDEVRVARLISGIEMLADGTDDDTVDLGCRNPTN
jgi:hypothetical protein